MENQETKAQAKLSALLTKNIGSVFKLPIASFQHVYAVFLPDLTHYIFDKIFNEDLQDLSLLLELKKLLRVPVMSYVLTKRIWPRVGRIELNNELTTPAIFYRRVTTRVDSNSRDVYKYLIVDGIKEIMTTKEECAVYEEELIWGPDQLVDRINKIYCNRASAGARL